MGMYLFSRGAEKMSYSQRHLLLLWVLFVFVFPRTHFASASPRVTTARAQRQGKPWLCLGQTAGSQHSASHPDFKWEILLLLFFFPPITAGACQLQEPSALTPPGLVFWGIFLFAFFIFLPFCFWNKRSVVKLPCRSHCCLSSWKYNEPVVYGKRDISCVQFTFISILTLRKKKYKIALLYCREISLAIDVPFKK